MPKYLTKNWFLPWRKETWNYWPSWKWKRLVKNELMIYICSFFNRLQKRMMLYKALRYACKRGYVESMKQIVPYIAYLQQVKDSTLLNEACKQGCVELVEILIGMGADVNCEALNNDWSSAHGPTRAWLAILVASWSAVRPSESVLLISNLLLSPST